MKILFTFYLASGGIVTLNLQRYQALQSEKTDCHFLYLTGGPGLQNMDPTKTFVTNKDEEIREIISKESYDLIVVILDYLFVSRLRRLGYRGKIIYDVQGFGMQIKELLETAKEHITSEVDGILSPKTPHLENLIDHYFPTIKKFHFHNCINFSSFNYQKLPKHPNKIIGWVGRIDPNKNWKLFLQLGAEIIKEDPTIELWMFEDPRSATSQERKRFKKMVTNLNLTNNLKSHFNVPYQKMADYYSIIGDSGGFLCSTSKKEGFGYAVLEAMCCHCPVLCTDSDGIKSFVLHNQTGKIIPDNNLQAAVEETNKLLHDENLRKELSTNALKHIKANFTPSILRENFLEMLHSIDLKESLNNG
ncbi:glycosyltransferase family 4 protein [Metabacillus sp. Hm71]|uniref:glycosyltransferase family 4 protein n=1 Tax=Metabacillus sp. Hm71 TaxID=3450743 RepID=UPI003F43BB72